MPVWRSFPIRTSLFLLACFLAHVAAVCDCLASVLQCNPRYLPQRCNCRLTTTASGHAPPNPPPHARANCRATRASTPDAPSRGSSSHCA